MPNQRELFVRRLNDFLATARRVSEFLPKETAEHSVEITESIRFSGHFEANVRDPETGEPAGRVIYDGPVGAESVHEQTRVRTKYFFADRQQEDIVTFCNEVLATLRRLVSKAYQLFP